MRDRDDDAPVEHDPTGMRDLLARLPEPGPMPEDLVARITASLAEEARTGSPAGLRSDPARRGQLLELAPRRRSRWPLLGVAAAVVVLLGLGGVVASTAPGGLTAALDLGSGGDSADSGGAAASADQPAPEAAGARAVVTWSGTAYDGPDLATQAAALASSTDTGSGSGAAGADGMATPEGARACADGLGIARDAGLVVDMATFEGRPAAVLLVTGADGHSAYAVERSCSAHSHEILLGPVPVTP